MGAYAYATTVLSTHFIEGSRPKNLGKFNPDDLSQPAKETIEWVKEAFNTDEIHPIDPNLLLSTDDTTLFVFEGTSGDSEDHWDWKILDKSNCDSSVHSDFEVDDDAENAGGLRVCLTFTFTASGMSAPPYIAVSGLTKEELSAEDCPDGILAAKVPGLCKGGDDVYNNNIGWLVFLRADKRENQVNEDKVKLSIANKKFIHYNDEVLLPYICALHEKLGWKKGQPIPDALKACSWFDGDIGQLQTMLFEAREALDDAEKICRNKHSASSTGRQQPCDLSPVFKLIKQLQRKCTAKNDLACGLVQSVNDLFSYHLRAKGLNLDSNPRKKIALIDFLLCLPEIMEATMTKNESRSHSLMQEWLMKKLEWYLCLTS